MLVSTKIISQGEKAKQNILAPTTVLQQVQQLPTYVSKIVPTNDLAHTNDISTILLKPTKNIIIDDSMNTATTTKEKSINFTVAYLMKHIPNYNTLYYQEMENILSSISLNTSSIVDMFNNFGSLGEGIQSRVNIISSELCKNIDITYFDNIKKNVYEQICNPLSSVITILQKDSYDVFDKFNTECSTYLSNLEKRFNEFKLLRDKSFNDLSRLYFYKDFFTFLIKELIDRDICNMDYIATSVIGSRMVSISNSLIIIEQLKQQSQIKEDAFKNEMTILQDYLFILCPSLTILVSQDKKEFDRQFKTFLRLH